ncbi:uncharacterized protein LOC123547985 [Mercenaria mercenaria]|uniref:uncharacterized protein LOC123547985 n=1 Tax=Mercenaria mercenaria TaxID=6596 RepID=UPI00234F68E4|nr:uncharacterized protein LOC123547985 [Mercenaria mercenaria]
MWIYFVTGLVLVVGTYVSEQHDFTRNIFCNNEVQTWYEAAEVCKIGGGKLVAYDTGLGKSIAELNLIQEVDIWTADYARTKTWNGNRMIRNDGFTNLCGFSYANSTSLSIRDELFGDCYTKRRYFCMNSTTFKIDVFENDRFHIRCNDTFYSEDLARTCIKPGFFFWTSTILTANIERETLQTQTADVLCGAYTKDIGNYFINCNTKRLSLCQGHDGENYPFSKGCFSDVVNGTTTSTLLINQSFESSTEIQDIGLEVGLPIAGCLIILLGVIIFISVNKRMKQKSNVCSDNHTKDETNTHTNNDLNMYESLSQRNTVESSYSFLEVPCSEIEEKSPMRLEKNFANNYNHYNNRQQTNRVITLYTITDNHSIG